MAVIYVGVAAAFVVGNDDLNPGITAGVGAYGIVSLVLPRLLGTKLDCSTADTLVGTYRTRFFFRIAIADSAMLVGFAASIVADNLVPYLIGAMFAIIGFARVAPTDRNLERDQEELNQSGCAFQLRALLSGAQFQSGHS
jgi:hypothetical protein